MGRNTYAIIATLGIGPTHCFQQSLSGYKSSRGVDLGRFFSLLILQRNRKLEHMNDARGYSLTARLLHWVMAFIMITMLIAGIAMVYGPWEGKFPPARGMLYDYHRGMGFVLLVLVVVRIIARFITTPPSPLPDTISKFQQKIAHSVHGLMYLALIVHPIFGWYATNIWFIRRFNSFNYLCTFR